MIFCLEKNESSLKIKSFVYQNLAIPKTCKGGNRVVLLDLMTLKPDNLIKFSHSLGFILCLCVSGLKGISKEFLLRILKSVSFLLIFSKNNFFVLQ